MSIASVTDLIDVLRQHNLLDTGQLEEADKLRDRFPEPKGLARELLQRGWLTAYQVNQVFAGNARDLNVGQYLLLERLGQGGMGQVFKAHHKGLHRVVALKVIRKERLDSPDAIRRFRREMHAVAQLSHPNFIHAFDADEVDGTHFIVMEFYDGIDLGKLVKLWGALPVPLACEYIRQAALGLQHAHERGLVHRDIKPSNLLVTYPGGASGTALAGDRRPECPGVLASGQVASSATAPTPVIKILDMGLARIQQGEDNSTITREGTSMGTPDYISPEQARDSHNVDIRSDLYSLGCAFYYLLAGHVPFPGGTMTSKLVKHQRMEPEPIENRRADVSVEVGAIVRRLMAKSPADRFQTPVELAQALIGAVSLVDALVGVGVGPSSAVALGSGVGVDRSPMASAESAMSSAIIPGGTPRSGVTVAPQPPPAQTRPPQPVVVPTNSDVSSGWSSMLLTTSSNDSLPSPRKVRRQFEAVEWRKLVRVGLSVLCIASVLVAGLVWWQLSGSGPAALAVQVAADRPWQDSMVDVSARVPVTIRAEGFWRKKQVSYSATGLKTASRVRAVTPDEPYMSVIVRIGDDTTVFGIEQPIVPKTSGRLFLQPNDIELDSNSGSVMVYVEGGTLATEPVATPGH